MKRDEIIQKLKSVLLAERSRLRNDDVGVITSVELRGDSYDISSAIEEVEMSMTLRSMDSSKLNDIEFALERIENGTYGVCIDCGKNIPIRRLCALPFASKCVGCSI
jgi:DnaK suppressor protein